MATAAPSPIAVASPSDTPPAHRRIRPAPSAAEIAWELVSCPTRGSVGSIADVVALPGAVVAVGLQRSGRRAGHRLGIERSAARPGSSEPLPGRARAIGRLIALGRACADARRRRWRLRPPVGHVDLVRDAGGAGRPRHSIRSCAPAGSPNGAAAGDHAVILGTGAGDVAFAWSSDDGLTWTDRSRAVRGPAAAGRRRRWVRLHRLRCRAGAGAGRHGAPTGSAWDAPVTAARTGGRERSSATRSCSAARSSSSSATRAAPSACCDPTGAAAGDRS